MPERLDKASVPDWARVDWRRHVSDVTVDGRRMRYVDLGKGRGPALVLVHGTGGSWQSWLLNLVELSRRHRVIAVDLPGFGKSDPLGPDAGMEEYGEAVASVLAALRVDQAIAIGHSLGGVVALRMALSHPDVTAGVVSVNGGGVALGGLRLKLVTTALLCVNELLSRESLVRAVISRRRLRRLLVALAMHDRDALTAELAAEMIAGFAAPGLIAAVAAGARDDIADRVQELACPTLLLWGRHDRLLPVGLAEALVQRMQSARLEVIEGAGHCPMIERPDDFNRAVEAFAGEVEQASVERSLTAC